MDFLPVDWNTYHSDVFELAKKITFSGKKFDLLIGISRGGLTLSHILSDFIDLPITTFTISSYHDLQQDTVPKIILKLGEKLHNKRILLVDDISDSGKTFIRGTTYLQSVGAESIHTASLFVKHHTEFTPTYSVHSIESETWLIFPYERRETIQSLIRRFSKEGMSYEQIVHELKTLKIEDHFISYYFPKDS